MDNPESGKQEIWRREKIFITIIFFFFPYGFIVIMPLSHFVGNWIEILLFALYGLFVVFVGSWLCNSPCPSCGKAIWAPITKFALRYKNCIHCGLELRPLTAKDYKISLKPIHYKPGSIIKESTEHSAARDASSSRS